MPSAAFTLTKVSETSMTTSISDASMSEPRQYIYSDYICHLLTLPCRFIIAAAKFSIKSRVSLTDERFRRYLSLVGDHLSLINDLASYDKELRAFNKGEASDLINLVAIMKSVTSLQDTDDAKSVAWALQLQIEKKMMEELEDLRAQGLSDEEWWFLEAVTCAAVGNVMFCMTSSRYGGEAARIRNRNESTELSLSQNLQ